MVESPYTGRFNTEDYFENPDRYKPIFHEKYLPYLSILFNCIQWEPKYPRLIEIE